jgi:hypothetical protein
MACPPGGAGRKHEGLPGLFPLAMLRLILLFCVSWGTFRPMLNSFWSEVCTPIAYFEHSSVGALCRRM